MSVVLPLPAIPITSMVTGFGYIFGRLGSSRTFVVVPVAAGVKADGAVEASTSMGAAGGAAAEDEDEAALGRSLMIAWVRNKCAPVTKVHSR
jgi:hypothetical protein